MFVGDNFLRETFDSFDAIVRQAGRKEYKNKVKVPMPYLEEYYNVEGYYSSTSQVTSSSTSRIFNATMDALND